MITFHRANGPSFTDIGSHCKVAEMPFPILSMTTGLLSISGRDPECGDKETSSDMVLIVLEGEITLCVNHTFSEIIKPHGHSFVPKGARYHISNNKDALAAKVQIIHSMKGNPFTLASRDEKRTLDLETTTLEVADRFPETGFVSYQTDALITVLEGAVFVFHQNGSSEIFLEWDTLCLPKGTLFYWVTDSKKSLLQITQERTAP